MAISHECDYPPDALTRPRVSRPRFALDGLSSAGIDAAVRRVMADHGSVYELDAERLRLARPDLVLSQAVCEVCAVPTSLAERAVELLDDGAEVLSVDSHTIDDILASVVAVGRAAGVEDRAMNVAAQYRRRIEAVREAVASHHPVRVLAVEWLDPPFLPGHWTPEMVEAAGGITLGAEARISSKQTTWSDLADGDPDVLIVMPCGYGLEAAVQDADAHAERLRTVAARAIGERRAFVVDGSAYFNRSGPRMVDGVEILGALLHPDVFPQYDLVGKAQCWVPD